ncbi:MAG: DegT/DnrJ/EryC1/StrS family aminotransferase [Gammaproteobacteria bacterium]|nr:DegT/DnrJ/EryC1/StrS family aminotransferase [Gammaproteobacteria bacterium]
MINVTKTYLPNREKFNAYIDQIYESAWLTNNGSLVQLLEKRLKDFLGVKHLILVSNGSLALQTAYKALDLQGEVITTPFSFVATTSTLIWEKLTPVFSDIDPTTFNINPDFIAEKITDKTSAILPVHVFGNPCEVEKIAEIAKKNNLKVIYDAAHAFGINYKNRSVLNYGDISTLSFHATKLFHTIEGGALITKDDALAKKIRLLINFGITGPETIEAMGVNAKMNEFEAAMGLCILDEVDIIGRQRKEIWKNYVDDLKDIVQFQKFNHYANNNNAYAPILLKDEVELLKVHEALKNNNIIPRRYFYPSLDTLSYIVPRQTMLISRDISRRILCLPIYPGFEYCALKNVIKILVEICCIKIKSLQFV